MGGGCTLMFLMLIQSRAARYAIGVVAIGSAIWGYGRHMHQQGVKDTTREFVEADRKGAEDAEETAKRVLRDIGNVDDPDELLRETGGLRDD